MQVNIAKTYACKKAITISTSTIIDKSLKTIFRFLIFEENKIILAVIMNPQIK